MNPHIPGASLSFVYPRLVMLNGRPIGTLEIPPTLEELARAIRPYAGVYSLLVKHKIISMRGIHFFINILFGLFSFRKKSQLHNRRYATHV